MAGSYFIKRGEKVIGPMSPDALKERISDGKIRETDQVAKASSGPWKSIGDIPALASLFESDDDRFDAYGDDSYDTPPLPPSMPAKKIRDKKTRETQYYGDTSTVPCRVCGKRVAKEAKTCPKCGIDRPCKITKHNDMVGKQWFAILVFCCLIGVGSIFGCFSAADSYQKAANSAAKGYSNDSLRFKEEAESKWTMVTYGFWLSGGGTLVACVGMIMGRKKH
jgi:hypothetical protein